MLSFPKFWSDRAIKGLVNALVDSVGDDILENSRGLTTNNGRSGRIWDFINTHIYQDMPRFGCDVGVAKRGYYEFVPMYHRDSRTLLTLMREKNFFEVSRKQCKRKDAHYLDALARVFNANIEIQDDQLSLFSSQHVFRNEDRLAEIAERFLCNFPLELMDIDRHVLILFSTQGDSLLGVRAAILDGNLNIAAHEDWSHFIKAQEGTVVATVDTSTATTNNPTHGMALTTKALERQHRTTLEPRKEESENEDVNE